MKYEFRDGFRARAVTAEQAHTEMERLREAGPLTATALFDAARPSASPLHGEFEWDGDKAVTELGLIRARTLLRAVVVIAEEDEPATPPHRVYVHSPAEVPGQAEGTYIPLTEIAQQPDAYARALDELTRKFNAAEAALTELRQAARQDGAPPQRLEAIIMATQAFSAARQALAALAV